MHRFPTRRSLTRLKASSFLWVILFLCFLAVIPILVWGLVLRDPLGLRISIGLLVGIPVLALVQAILASNVRCPLCHGHLMSRPRCALHRNARRALGSLRLRVALGVFFLGRLRCQYCGEPSDTRRARRRG